MEALIKKCRPQYNVFVRGASLASKVFLIYMAARSLVDCDLDANNKQFVCRVRRASQESLPGQEEGHESCFSLIILLVESIFNECT